MGGIVQHSNKATSNAPACGCKSGAAFVVAALVAWPVWVALSGPPTTPADVVLSIATYAGVVVGAGVAGKVAGIAAVTAARRARLQHRPRPLAGPRE
jgi:hypothetical protein